MGLLDDAIREHLDLKRSRGADPAEIQRAEHEALGPVRRGPVEAEPPELVLDEAHTPLETRAEIAPELFTDGEDPFGDQGPSESERTPPGLNEKYDKPDPPQVRFEEPAPPPHRASIPRDRLGETVEYDLEEALGEPSGPEEPARPPARPAGQKAPKGADEDPLEETPEFLQETPDHDRLWFEQRPPRDFDFDG